VAGNLSTRFMDRFGKSSDTATTEPQHAAHGAGE
jgi:hypothetical protein